MRVDGTNRSTFSISAMPLSRQFFSCIFTVRRIQITNFQLNDFAPSSRQRQKSENKTTKKIVAEKTENKKENVFFNYHAQ